MRAARRGRDGKGRRAVGKGGEGAVMVTASKSRRGEADRIALLMPEGTLSPEVV